MRFLKWFFLCLSVFAVGTFLYAQTSVIGIPWELRGTQVYIGTQATGQVLINDGTAALPALSFTSGNTTGAYKFAGLWAISIGGGLSQLVAVGSTVVPALVIAGAGLGSQDVFINRDGPNILAQKNGNADQTQRWYGSNGAYFQVAAQSELLTILSAASTDTAMTIPANAIVRGVAVYVVTVIPTAATFTVTGATSGTTFNTAAVGTGAGSNDVGTQNTPYKNGVAQLIRITPNLVPIAATGQVRIVLFYEIPSAPTS